MNPVIIHARSSPPVDPVYRAISAETMKMPEPIIDPTTIMVESKRFSPRTKPTASLFVGAVVVLVEIDSDTKLHLDSVKGKLDQILLFDDSAPCVQQITSDMAVIPGENSYSLLLVKSRAF